MHKKRDMMSKIFLALIVVAVAAASWYLLDVYVFSKPVIDPTLTAILDDPSIKNNTVDYMNNVGVKSLDDVAYSLADDGIRIHYGKQDFTVQENSLNNQDLIKALDMLHLQIYKNKNNVIIVLYGGKRVTQWVQTK